MKTNGVKLRALFACLFFSVLLNGVFAQTNGVVRCYTDENNAILHANHPELESTQQFEQWIQSEMAANMASGKIIGGVYQIPVVVHVIHNGEAVGTASNVSYAAIQSQIDVLNEDFRRIFGSNGYNTNPLGADTQIEFCLSKRRPDGSAYPNGEDGVNRINRNTAGFTAPPYSQTYVENTIKAYSYNNNTPAVVGTYARGWDPAKYMNIWLCNLGNGLLGYAQFPQSPLGGMGCGSPVNGTDGVVFLYSSIGKSSVTGFPGPYNEGRTATHEIGHWLGLRHIWGDGGCTVDDYCNDTPEAAAANYGCPTINSCTNAPDPGNDMVENYMDYTDDACMNIFTNDQKQRMRAVLEGSPLRLSLINSDACTPPNPSDASVTDVFAPVGDNCAGPITPSVQLKNRGSNNLTSATISYKVDNGTAVTYSWTGNLAPNSTATVALPAFTAPLGVHSFRAYSTLPNGIADPYTVYDTSGIDFVVSNGIMPNYTQDFEAQSFPPDVRWRVDNVNGDCYKWTPASGMSSTGTFINNIAELPFFGDGSTSNEDLYTPVFLLPCNATAATLKFDVAYRKRVAASNDQLIVQISTDCGATWTNVYSKSGNVSPYLWQNSTLLATEYYPTVATDWRTETISLMSYVGTTSKNLMFRFRGVSNNGNNIFIDNVKFEGTTPGEINVTVAGNDVLDEGFYNFANTQTGGSTTATFTVTNTGTTNLTLTNPITVTGTGFALGTGFGTTTVTPGSTTTFTVTFSPATAGNFTGTVSFGTNDCDEGTYNFILNGSGIATPPVADFSAAQTTICQGSTVTFTNLSTYATSYAWTFTGGTPGTSTATSPTVTYNTAGTYAVTLVATNANGSDTETKNAYITVVASTATALPLSEGFTTTTFVPTGWSLINNNASPTSWARSTTVGRAPTAGNSMWFNNYAYNDSDDDVVRLKALAFTGLSSAQMTFDVAYAPYDAANYDGLEVLVSTNCGSSFTSVYSKSNTTLATAAATGNTAFVPTTSQWRTETIDLTPYIGQANVIIAFKNLSGYGNNLYVDNINVTGVVSSTPPTPSFTTVSSTVCAGQSITYTNTSTGSPTSYSWSFPGGTPSTSTAASPTVTYNTAGTYNVVLTATNGSGSNTTTMTNYVTVNAVPATPTITTGGSTTFCSGGSVTLTSSAGNSYLWSTGATTQSITATTAGTYTVQVSSAAGCQSAASAATTVVVNPTPSAPTITAGGATALCSGGSVTLTSTTGNAYLWSTGATTQSITVSAAGTYTCKVVSSAGCQSPNSNAITVTVGTTPATPTVTAGGSTTFCSGGSVTLTSSAGTSYLWSNGATTQSITATTAGTYTVQVSNPAGCQSAASSATTVTVNPTPSAPTLTAGGATTFCSGGSVTLTSTTGNAYLWSTGATTQSITATTAGTYTVKVVSPAGCQSPNSNAITVTVNPTPAAPTITAGGTTTFCSGGSVTLTSSAGSSYLWSNGATTQTITATTAGTYTVQVSNASGCQSAASAATTVTVNPTPATPAITAGGATTFCSGGSVALTSTAGNSYLWSNGATTQTITATTAGTYTVQVTNASGCQSAASAATTVTVNPTPAAPTISASGPTTFCSGTPTTLTSTAGSSYLWSNGATTQTITPSTSGTYTVQVTNASGCQSTASAGTSITVNPTPAITLGTLTDPNACGSTTGSIAVNGTGSGSISWTGAASGSTTVASLPTTISSLGAGSYTIVLTSGAGCASNSIMGSLTDPGAPTPPVITPTSTILCPGGTVTLTSSYTSGNTWSTTETASSITISAAGTYTVQVTNAGCTSTSNPVTITAAAPFSVNAGNDQAICSGGSVTLTGASTGSPTLGWSNGVQDGVAFVPAGTTTYTLTATDGNGCQLTDQVLVTVNSNPTVAFASLGQVCTYNPAFVLTGGSPAGGTYSGTGVSSGSFDPAASGAGSFPITYIYTDANGCSGTAQSTIIVDPCLSVGENEKWNMSIYPNPSIGQIEITSDVPYSNLKMVDAQGKLIFDVKIDQFEPVKTIDLSAYANGHYTLQVYGEFGTKYHQVVISK
ncbi:PKD domain-containing protein [Fluviicola sp.]|uniref:PKD domain-containing protein n=1 Tax=Fluviicola sp. TaxID=1917219 RepID=UPI0031E3EDE9